MKIDVLYFEGCPNHKPTVQRVKDVLDRLGIEVDVNDVEVTERDDPAALKFIGSPTVLVDGQDIDPDQRQEVNYGFGCRTFAGAGVPSDEMIERAVRQAAGGNGRVDDCCSPKALQSNDRSSRGNDGSQRLSFWSTPAALGSAILSSACCWVPLLLLALGLSAGGVAGVFEAARPFFLAAAAIFLTAGFYFAYFRKPACKPGDACLVPNPKLHRFSRAMLWVATAFVIAFALFPYYSPALVRAFANDSSGQVDSQNSNGADQAARQVTRSFPIDGMTCEACAATLEVRLAKLPGVQSVRVSYPQADATMISAPDKPDETAVRAAVEQAGYRVPRPPDP